MYKKFLLLISLSIVIFLPHSLEARPAKGYLNTDEIKSLLDQYSKPVKLDHVVSVLGKPTEFGSFIWSWYFEEYSTMLMFERIGGTDLLTSLKVVQICESQYDRDDLFNKAIHRLNTIFGGKVPRSGTPRKDMVLKEGASSATWDLDDGRIFSVFNYQYKGLPCLMYIYAPRDI